MVAPGTKWAGQKVMRGAGGEGLHLEHRRMARSC